MSKKVVAVSSVGGHWTELLRLRSAFHGYETIYITTNDEYRSMVGGSRFYSIRDFNRKNPWVLVGVIFRLLSVFLKERPDCIISTGAAPGLAGLFFCRKLCI
jgi:UDP-N-acetylglucosamine:LPS N-acetylglucosamine transferase